MRSAGWAGEAMERVPAAWDPASWPCTGDPPGRSSDLWWPGAALWHDREVAPALASVIPLGHTHTTQFLFLYLKTK